MVCTVLGNRRHRARKASQRWGVEQKEEAWGSPSAKKALPVQPIAEAKKTKVVSEQGAGAVTWRPKPKWQKACWLLSQHSWC